MIGNNNPEADAAAARGPNPSQARGSSHVQSNGVSNGSHNAVAAAEEMENGEAGPGGKKSIVTQLGKSK